MSEYRLILLLVLAGLIAVALVLHLPPRRSRAQGDPPTDRDYAGDAYPDDGQHWLGGLIYYNPDDPALFVPKRFGIGWTLNFGHPQGKLVVAAALLLFLVLALLGPLVRVLAG